jgi:hypothetical protein
MVAHTSILPTEIGRIEVGGQPRQIVLEALSPKLLEQNGLEVLLKL